MRRDMTLFHAGAIQTPDRSRRAVGLWLLACAVMVFAMVLIGGITRLTESGLSITEWRPVSGILPPLSEAEWQHSFALYRAIPQYQALNAGMSLADYKSIYWWEFIHRLWGRLIGVVFIGPFLWFLARHQIERREAPYLGAIFALGLAQGALGWYMVASGLSERISVSPYRLTAHLGLAVIIYATLLWSALAIGSNAERVVEKPWLSRLAWATLGLIFLTMLAGGFVAGLQAGLIYNDFPLMGGRFVPEDYGFLEPFWRNLFENPAAAQFDHRLLAMTSAAMSLATALAVLARARRSAARRAAFALLLMAPIQVTIGIGTLLLSVPTALAATHQAGALLLFTFALRTAFALKTRAG